MIGVSGLQGYVTINLARKAGGSLFEEKPKKPRNPKLYEGIVLLFASIVLGWALYIIFG